MKELIIDKLGDNQRLDKYLSKYLSAASKSFIYKMLRKKNITLNNKKSDGKDKLAVGDCVKIFMTEARNYNQATLSKYFFLMKHLISSVKAKAAYLMLAADRPII